MTDGTDTAREPSTGERSGDGTLRGRLDGDPRSRFELPADFSRGQKAAAVVGVIAVVVAVLGLLVPALVPGPIRGVVTTLPAGVTLFLLVLLGLVLAVASSRRQPSSVEPVEREPLRTPRRPEGRSPAVGWSVDDLLDEASDFDLPREYRASAREQLRDRVRTAALHALARETDADRAAVATALERGTWTTDRRASALLGGPDAPRPPWYVRLWDLLRSEPAVRRRTRHALRAVREARERGTLVPVEPGDGIDGGSETSPAEPADGSRTGGAP